MTNKIAIGYLIAILNLIMIYLVIDFTFWMNTTEYNILLGCIIVAYSIINAVTAYLVIKGRRNESKDV